MGYPAMLGVAGGLPGETGTGARAHPGGGRRATGGPRASGKPTYVATGEKGLAPRPPTPSGSRLKPNRLPVGSSEPVAPAGASGAGAANALRSAMAGTSSCSFSPSAAPTVEPGSAPKWTSADGSTAMPGMSSAAALENDAPSKGAGSKAISAAGGRSMVIVFVSTGVTSGSILQTALV